MSDSIENLGEPHDFWFYFKKITEIPRCSKHEEKIRAYIEEEAERMRFDYQTDAEGNIAVYLDSKNQKDAVILQSHMDMVCEKNAGINHDFSQDALNLEIVEKDGEKWLSAKGTTLGADNGVGIALSLTIMKLIHKGTLTFKKIPIMLLFTVDEESGLTGAFNIDPNLIHGKYLINLDSEEDDSFTIGCAGGINTICSITYEAKEKETLEAASDYIPLKISISGLIGGHSGVDIHKGRANAIKMLAKIMWKLNHSFDIIIISMNGGNRPNAIPREANSEIYCYKDQLEKLENYFNQIKSEIILGIGKNEPEMKMEMKFLPEDINTAYIPQDLYPQILSVMYGMPNGPISMHHKIKDLVYTSTNLASIQTEAKTGKIIITTSQRSIHEISKKIIYERIEGLFGLISYPKEITHIGNYPGWEPNFDSSLVKIAQSVYNDLFGEEPTIQAIHAGLECGILKQHHPEMEMISIGPDIDGPHSPDEKLRIASIEKFWSFLLEFLRSMH